MLDPEAVYRSTLDNLLEGFQIVDRQYRYVYVNVEAAKQGRSTPERLIGRLMAEAYPGIELSPFFDTLRRCLDERVPSSLENLFTFPDGSQRWFELRVEPVPLGACIHSIDIDDRKKAEAALVRINEELEARVEARTRELEAAYEELEAFSYSVSHDLRSPLRAIDGFARILVENNAAQLDEASARHFARIRAAAQRMGALIDDLLTLSRVNRGPIKRVDVDLSVLAHAIVEELRARDPARDLEITIAADLRTHCDAQLARIVLNNLLENAWKFTAKRAGARVQVRESAERPGSFVVEDNGAGFDMRYASRIFSPFQRFHHERDFPGTGIGLATVHRIVRRHGGSVRATSAVDEGTAVTFRFQGEIEASAGGVAGSSTAR